MERTLYFMIEKGARSICVLFVRPLEMSNVTDCTFKDSHSSNLYVKIQFVPYSKHTSSSVQRQILECRLGKDSVFVLRLVRCT